MADEVTDRDRRGDSAVTARTDDERSRYGMWRMIDSGRYDDAEYTARSLVSAHPMDPEGYRGLARALLGRRMPAQALEAAEVGAALAPGDPELQLVVTDAARALGDQKRAVEAAGAIVVLLPDVWLSHYQLALALLCGRRPRPAQALESAERAVRLAPDSPEARHLRGVCLEAVGRHDDARLELTEALRLDPGRQETQTALDALAAGANDTGRRFGLKVPGLRR